MNFFKSNVIVKFTTLIDTLCWRHVPINWTHVFGADVAVNEYYSSKPLISMNAIWQLEDDDYCYSLPFLNNYILPLF